MSRMQNYEYKNKKILWKEYTYNKYKGYIKLKIYNHWFLQLTNKKCNAKNHNMCRNDTCLVYLVGKRESRVFPESHMA